MELAVSCDMLVEGRHFFPMPTLPARPQGPGGESVRPRGDGRDAALGLACARPAGGRRGLAGGFSEGFHALAERFGVSLIGGDTTRGPLNLCVTILGEVAGAGRCAAMPRGSATTIWVSGELGGAALGLRICAANVSWTRPRPPPALPACMRPSRASRWASVSPAWRVAAIDISDGLLADLGHILERSGVGAELELARLPAPSLGCTTARRASRAVCWPAAMITNCVSPPPAGDHAAVLAAGVRPLVCR
jgi:thiamine-monophosphate kinase